MQRLLSHRSAAGPPAVPSPEPAEKTRGRVRMSLLHPGRGQILAAVILFVVGAAGVMQIKATPRETPTRPHGARISLSCSTG